MFLLSRSVGVSSTLQTPLVFHVVSNILARQVLVRIRDAVCDPDNVKRWIDSEPSPPPPPSEVAEEAREVTLASTSRGWHSHTGFSSSAEVPPTALASASLPGYERMHSETVTCTRPEKRPKRTIDLTGYNCNAGAGAAKDEVDKSSASEPAASQQQHHMPSGKISVALGRQKAKKITNKRG